MIENQKYYLAAALLIILAGGYSLLFKSITPAPRAELGASHVPDAYDQNEGIPGKKLDYKDEQRFFGSMKGAGLGKHKIMTREELGRMNARREYERRVARWAASKRVTQSRGALKQLDTSSILAGVALRTKDIDSQAVLSRAMLTGESIKKAYRKSQEESAKPSRATGKRVGPAKIDKKVLKNTVTLEDLGIK